MPREPRALLSNCYRSRQPVARLRVRKSCTTLRGPRRLCLAAWMLDHDPKSYQLIARAFAGNPGGLSRDDVLDNVTPGFLRLSSTGKTSSDSSRSRASRFRLGSASFRTSFTKRHAIPSDDDYGRSQSSRLSAAIRDGWARCPERMGRLFGFVDPGDIALFGLTAVVLGQGSMTRFSDPELNLSRRIGDT